MPIAECQKAILIVAKCICRSSRDDSFMPLRNFAAKLSIAALCSLTAVSAVADMTATAAEQTMTFPPDRSYGRIINLGTNWNILHRHPQGTFVGEARGKIRYPSTENYLLRAKFPLVDNPDVISSIPADAFKSIDIVNLPAENKIFAPLSHLTGLRRLDFEEGDFDDKGFEKLAKLVNLEVISLKECFVTGRSFTHFGALKKLRVVILRKMELDWKLLNQSSPVFPAMDTLHLVDTNLNDEGLKWTEKMPNLSRLYLDGCPKLTDKGLLAATKLKKLRQLELKKMNVTPKGIMQLKGTGISSIHIQDANFTSAQEKQLQDSMPNVRFVFGKKQIPGDTMDLFAPLH